MDSGDEMQIPESAQGGNLNRTFLPIKLELQQYITLWQRETPLSPIIKQENFLPETWPVETVPVYIIKRMGILWYTYRRKYDK